MIKWYGNRTEEATARIGAGHRTGTERFRLESAGRPGRTGSPPAPVGHGTGHHQPHQSGGGRDQGHHRRCGQTHFRRRRSGRSDRPGTPQCHFGNLSTIFNNSLTEFLTLSTDLRLLPVTTDQNQPKSIKNRSKSTKINQN